MKNKEIEDNLVNIKDSFSLALTERDLLYTSLAVVEDKIKKLEDAKSRLEQASAVLAGLPDDVVAGVKPKGLG